MSQLSQYTMLDQYKMLARYNSWMTAKVYDICDTLAEEELKRDRGAFFRSIHSTLNHIVMADRFWYGRFTGTRLEIKPLGEDLFEDYLGLKEAHMDFTKVLRDWVSTLSLAELNENITYTSSVDGSKITRPKWELVTHLFNHQTHHRGQITTLFSQLGLDIGATDLPFMPPE